MLKLLKCINLPLVADVWDSYLLRIARATEDLGNLRNTEVVERVLQGQMMNRDYTTTYASRLTSKVLDTCFEFVPLLSQTSEGM